MDNSTRELCGRIFNLLEKASELCGSEFTGTGVIVHPEPSKLGLFPIAFDAGFQPSESVEQTIADISKPDSPWHDGFHILNPALELVAVSQYFSPSVIQDLSIDRERPFGGRYLAALFGSKIDGMIATGIATRSLGTVVFREGRELDDK